MTKKITLVFVLFLFVFGLRAESLLNEGFEGWSTTNFPTGGWTVINDTQEGAINHWTVDNSKSACAGSVSLYCNGGEWDPIEPVKEEWIVSPSLIMVFNTPIWQESSSMVPSSWIRSSALETFFVWTRLVVPLSPFFV